MSNKKNRKAKDKVARPSPVVEELVTPQLKPDDELITDKNVIDEAGAMEDPESNSQQTGSSDDEGDNRADSDGDISDNPSNFDDLIEQGVKSGISEFMEKALPDILQSQITEYLTRNGFRTDGNDHAMEVVPQSQPKANRSPKGLSTSPLMPKTPPVVPKPLPMGTPSASPLPSIVKDPASFVTFGTTESTIIGAPTKPLSVTKPVLSIGNFIHSLYSIMCITFSSHFVFIFFTSFVYCP